LWKWLTRRGPADEPDFPASRTWERRTLMSGGTILILLGFLHGGWYAAVDLYRHEAREAQILKNMLDAANNGGAGTVVQVASYGSLAAGKGVKNTATPHVINLGVLAMLL